jgi:hypothetical protein
MTRQAHAKIGSGRKLGAKSKQFANAIDLQDHSNDELQQNQVQILKACQIRATGAAIIHSSILDIIFKVSNASQIPYFFWR